MLPKDTRIGLLAPITWEIPPQKYGPWELAVTNLANGLVKYGYTNVTLYATKEARIPGVNNQSIISHPFGGTDALDKHAQELLHIAHSMRHAEKHCDLIHNHLDYYPVAFSPFISAPFITTLHGLGQNPNANTVFLAHKDLPYVSISNAERRQLPTLNYVSTIYHGIDFSEFKLSPNPQDYLVYTGRIHPEKGVHLAIKLAKRLGKSIFIAGIVQPEMQNYFQTVIVPELNESTVYLGNLGRREIAELVGSAEAYIGLIDVDEAFGFSIAEAIACGTPAVATPRGSHVELIRPGETGILVNSLDEAVARYGEVLKIDRTQCREVGKTMFSIETMVEGYLAVYEKVLRRV